MNLMMLSNIRDSIMLPAMPFPTVLPAFRAAGLDRLLWCQYIFLIILLLKSSAAMRIKSKREKNIEKAERKCYNKAV